jgi:hypothetical protein
MTKAWARLVRRVLVQVQARTLPPAVFRYGYLQSLPSEPTGERHVAVSKRDPTRLLNVERCEFEELLGPAPAGDEISFEVYLSFEAESETPL